MKEKYEEMKMEVIAFEENIWTQMGVSALDNPSSTPKTVTLVPADTK